MTILKRTARCIKAAWLFVFSDVRREKTAPAPDGTPEAPPASTP